MRVLEDGAIEADHEACTSAGVPANRVTRTIEVLNLNAERLRVGEGEALDCAQRRVGRLPQ